LIRFLTLELWYVNRAVVADDKAKNLPLDAEAEYKTLKAEADNT